MDERISIKCNGYNANELFDIFPLNESHYGYLLDSKAKVKSAVRLTLKPGNMDNRGKYEIEIHHEPNDLVFLTNDRTIQSFEFDDHHDLRRGFAQIFAKEEVTASRSTLSFSYHNLFAGLRHSSTA